MKTINQLFGVGRLKTTPLKTVGVIFLSLIFIMGLSACKTTQALSGHAKSKELAKNLSPDKKPSIAHVQSSPADKSKEVDKQAIMQKALKLQMPFIANEGQTAKEVGFYASTFGGAIYVTKKGEMVYSFSQVEPEEKATNKDSMPKTIKSLVLKETLVGASVTNPQGNDRAKTKVNYFIGNDKDKWKTNISTYNSVDFGNVYKGIDLSLKAYGKTVEKVFTVQPGANPESIKLKMEGGNSLKVNEKGELELETDLGVIRFSKPLAYQEKDGKQEKVQVAYYINKGAYGFMAGDYDKSLPLIIDPILIYLTYLGGGDWDQAQGIAVDGSGNAYVTGYTISTDFPTQNPYQAAHAGPVGSSDVFVAQLSADGSSLNYSTYLGGSDNDYGQGIAVDGLGNAYVTGYTASTDFPTQNPYQAYHEGPVGDLDAFVAQLGAAGSSLNYSTYLGGSQGDWSIGIAVDSLGNAYVTGYTASTDFPTQNPYQAAHAGPVGGTDAFVAQLSAIGSSLNYSTYLGGGDWDQPRGIAVDGLGNAYVTGDTASTNLPTQNPYQAAHAGPVGGLDAFVAKIAPDTDGDGMDDNWENAHGLNPNVDDSGGDPDFDGLSNLEEYQNNTDPQDSDTDGDGLNDGYEVSIGTDPLTPNPAPPNHVLILNRSIQIHKSGCERVGSVNFGFVEESDLNAGDSWYIDLPPDVTICRSIDYLIVGDTSGGTVDIRGGAQATSFAGSTAIPTMAPDTYLGPLKVDKVEIISGSPAWTLVNGSIAIRVTANQGEQRILVELYGASADSSITVGQDTRFNIKILDGDLYTSNILLDSDSNGIYGDGGPADLLPGPEPDVNNTLCTDTSGMGGTVMDVTYGSIPNKFSFYGDDQIAHVLSPVSLQACAGATSGNILIDESNNDCSFEYETADGYFPNDTFVTQSGPGVGTGGNLFLIDSGINYGDQYRVTVSLEAVPGDTTGVYFTGNPVLSGFETTDDACLDPTGGTAISTAWSTILDDDTTGGSYPASGTCTVPELNRVKKVVSDFSVTDGYNFILIDLPALCYDTAYIGGGTPVTVRVSLEKYPCGEMFNESRIIGTFYLAGDTDFDGMPDDWENDNGVNDPNADPDYDGLSNLEEYQNSTDPNNPDTDGDGLSDGDEVNTYLTLPLNPDSDNDGISDGVEVAAGTNPNDINDKPVYRVDDFYDDMIDDTIWTNSEFVRRIIDDGTGTPNNVLESAITSYGVTAGNQTNFSNSEMITSFQANVTVTDYVNNNAQVRARLLGKFYNTYYAPVDSGDGARGDVYAQVGIRDTGDDTLRGFYNVFVCENADCSDDRIIEEGPTPTSWTGTGTHTLSLSWNGTQFTFGFDTEVPVTYSPTGAAPIRDTSPKSYPGKYIGTRVQSTDGDPNRGGYINATFDNVFVNGNQYDSFETSDMIDHTKWNHWEFVRVVDSYMFESAITQHNSNGSNYLTFIYPQTITAYQTDITVTEAVNNGGRPFARLAGIFYNDGTSGGGRAGDIFGMVGITHNGDNLVPFYTIGRCGEDCNFEWDNLFYQEGGVPLAEGQPYRFSMAWDEASEQFNFGINGDTESVPRPPSAPVVKDASTPLNAIGTRVNSTGSGNWGYINARFDNVVVLNEWDSNYNGVPDSEEDFDMDGVVDAVDNCPDTPNGPEAGPDNQADWDGDGRGDVCDDSDGDGLMDDSDPYPFDQYNDEDGDTYPADTYELCYDLTAAICQSIDNCPEVPNLLQENSDGDAYGDACDYNEAAPEAPCTERSKNWPECSYEDPVPDDDICTSNSDSDDICDDEDNCDTVANPYDVDTDGDGELDAQLNTDNDELGDACDPDDDNDQIPDDGGPGFCTGGETENCDDNCPLIKNSDQADMDGNGVGDECDPDIDGDGLTNAQEIALGTDMKDWDSDDDGIADGSDPTPLGDKKYVEFVAVYVDADCNGTTDGDNCMDTWLPVPEGFSQALYKPGDEPWVQSRCIQIKAKLYDPSVSGYVSFENDVNFILSPSRMQGIATNHSEDCNINNDGKCLIDYNFINSQDDPDSLSKLVTISEPQTEVSLEVFSFDFGGSFTITASTVIPAEGSEPEYVAEGKVTLPLDSDNDGVPDIIEVHYGFDKNDQHSLSPEKLDGDMDVDTLTHNAYPGDGLTNGQEWRGIIYDADGSKHERLNPNKKNLFVRGDYYKNSVCQTTDNPDVLDFTLVVDTPPVNQSDTGNAFENAGIDVHDVTIYEYFCQEPPNIDVLVVTNKALEYGVSFATLRGTKYGLIQHPSPNYPRWWQWDLKGASYVGDSSTYAIDSESDRQATETYHSSLMNYIYNRPYQNETNDTYPDWFDSDKNDCLYNAADSAIKLDPSTCVEDWVQENGIGPERDGGDIEDRCIPKNDRLDGDRFMDVLWKTMPYGETLCQVGYDFSVFDVDGDGYVELPQVDTVEEIVELHPNSFDPGYEYYPLQVQTQTIIHEIGHALGVSINHVSDETCVMFVPILDWSHARHYCPEAIGQFFIHNE